MTKKNITPAQLVNLLSSAYGIVDDYGVLYSTTNYSFDNEGMVRICSTTPDSGEEATFSLQNACVDGSSLSMMNSDGEFEDFQILSLASGEDLI